MTLDIEEILINDLYDNSSNHESEQKKLRKKAQDKIKDGFSSIPTELECCFNCQGFNRASPQCESSKSSFNGKRVSNVLDTCCECEINIINPGG